MRKVDKLGKGIILTRLPEAHRRALPELLKKLKVGGCGVVAMCAKAPVETLAQYDEDVVKSEAADCKLASVSSVVQTISE